MCAGPGDQVNFNEAPSAADLERRKLTRCGQGAQRHGVQPQGRGGLGERQKRSGHLFFDGSANLLMPRPILEQHREPHRPQINRSNLLAAVTHLAADHLPRLAIDSLLLRSELLRRRTAARRALPAGQFLVAHLGIEMAMAVEGMDADPFTLVAKVLSDRRRTVE